MTFVRHTSCPECGSKDNLAVYKDANDNLSWHCFGCGYTKASKEYTEEPKHSNFKRMKTQDNHEVNSQEQEEEVSLPENKITPEEVAEIRDKTVADYDGYRGIKSSTKKFFAVRTEVDDENNVLATYYPITMKGKIVGYKRRGHPKRFRAVNHVSKNCDLFGQFKFENANSKKTVLIVGGEADTEAAYQMLKGYYLSKSWEYEPVVVSPVTGEKGADNLAKNYTFLNSFEKIVLGLDNDKAGLEAVEKCIKVLPKGKVYIAKWSKGKDPNEMLLANESKAFINDFYSSKLYVPVGVVASNQISDEMRKELSIAKLPLPKFMHKLEDMMAGGIPLGRIVNLGAASGSGKSTIIDEIMYYWLFNSPHQIGIVTLESTVGQYGVKLLSRHISNKIELMRSDDALSLLSSEIVKAKEYELFNKSNGEPRFYLVDDRDGGVDNIKDAIENLIIGCQCKIIVLDPIQDVIGSLPIDEQDSFMAWQKGMVKSHNVTFANVCHTRKTAGGQKAGSTGADLHEEDIFGSSSVYKSAACNLMFGRNKEAEDETERNTTVMKMTKCRWTGKTGIVGMYYYCTNEHTLYDLDDWLNKNS